MKVKTKDSISFEEIEKYFTDKKEYPTSVIIDNVKLTNIKHFVFQY